MFWRMLIHFEALSVHQLLPGAGRASDCSQDLHETNKRGLTIKGLHSHEESSLLTAFPKACPRKLLPIAVEKINTEMSQCGGKSTDDHEWLLGWR